MERIATIQEQKKSLLRSKETSQQSEKQFNHFRYYLLAFSIFSSCLNVFFLVLLLSLQLHFSSSYETGFITDLSKYYIDLLTGRGRFYIY